MPVISPEKLILCEVAREHQAAAEYHEQQAAHHRRAYETSRALAFPESSHYEKRWRSILEDRKYRLEARARTFASAPEPLSSATPPGAGARTPRGIRPSLLRALLCLLRFPQPPARDRAR